MSDIRGLSAADIQAIADAVADQMLSVPRELQEILQPHRDYRVSLDPLTRNGTLDNLMLRISTDPGGFYLEFSAYGSNRLATLRFNYRGWAWNTRSRGR